MKQGVIGLIVLIIILIGAGYYFSLKKSPEKTPIEGVEPSPSPTPASGTATSSVSTQPVDKTKTVLGASAGGNDILAYHFGEGTKEVLFIGGIHGGYEWNTALVAYELADYLKGNPSAVPANLKVTVIPVLNPDGLVKVVGTSSRFTASQVSSSQATQIAGRFNGNTVDLNRNFDCDWKAQGMWQNTSVSGGAAAFSEPESQAIKAYIDAHTPAAVVAFFSAAGGVFSSNCHGGVLPETAALTQVYAKASGYPAHENFDFYAVTGDITNWLAKNSIPAISVLLTNHTDTEWTKNQKGVSAVLQYLAK